MLQSQDPGNSGLRAGGLKGARSPAHRSSWVHGPAWCVVPGQRWGFLGLDVPGGCTAAGHTPVIGASSPHPLQGPGPGGSWSWAWVCLQIWCPAVPGAAVGQGVGATLGSRDRPWQRGRRCLHVLRGARGWVGGPAPFPLHQALAGFHAEIPGAGKPCRLPRDGSGPSWAAFISPVWVRGWVGERGRGLGLAPWPLPPAQPQGPT